MYSRFPTRYSQDKSGCKASSAPLFSHMQKAAFLMMQLNFNTFTNALLDYIVMLLTGQTRGLGGSVVELRTPEREVQGSNTTVPPYVKCP